jgi:hypothetical protein
LRVFIAVCTGGDVKQSYDQQLAVVVYEEMFIILLHVARKYEHILM